MEPPTSENVQNSGVMGPATSENLQNSILPDKPVDQNHESLDSDVLNNGGVEPQLEFKEEDIRSILELIAATGKFWHDWDKLKRMLSFHLKQVLSEYPEAKMNSEQQTSSLGETFPELAKRLDDALESFIEGPPFTLQRLCEILLGAQNIYPNLSKLALALEKNLLVTSMLTVCTDPYPQAPAEKPSTVERGTEDPQTKSSTAENGAKTTSGDGDEIMAEVEEADVNNDMTIDMEAFEEIVRSSETNSAPTGEL